GSPGPAAGTAHEQQRAAWPHPADGMLGDGDVQPHVYIEVAEGPLAVQVRQGRVVRARAGDHHVVDLSGKTGEEPGEGSRVGDVEGGGALRADFGCGL